MFNPKWFVKPSKIVSVLALPLLICAVFSKRLKLFQFQFVIYKLEIIIDSHRVIVRIK